jgi:hypothetical protein
MLALPPSERPKDRRSLFEWIFTELTQRGMTEELDFALKAERRCGEAALEVLNCLEHATRVPNSNALVRKSRALSWHQVKALLLSIDCNHARAKPQRTLVDSLIFKLLRQWSVVHRHEQLSRPTFFGMHP